jgi:murein DD-endopeptidase MepM/ murein hydrolase activator NlpD
MRRGFASTVAALALAVALPVSAMAAPSPSPTPSSKLDQDRAKLRDQKAFNELLQKTDVLRQAADQALAKLNSDLYLATLRLEQARRDASVARTKLDIAMAELRKARLDLSAAKVQLASRATHLYIIGPTGILPFVLGARDINDAMMADAYGNRVLAADSDAVTHLRAAERRVAAAEAVAASIKHRMDAEFSSAQLEQQSLQDLRDRQAYLRFSLFSDMKNHVAELSKLVNSSNPFAAVLAAFSSTGTGFTQEIRDAQEGQPDPIFTPHWLRKPVPGNVTQGFGWRTHPVFGYLSFHTGVDLAANYGDPVHPAQNGRVIDVGYFGPYGNTILIDNNGSIATLYCHLSKILVAPGDIVSVRTVIGEVGSTGWSTGPHLHFEVRTNGNPVEPTRWF